MLAFALLALCGVFGNGPLSRTSTAEGAQTLVAYERFARLTVPTTFRLMIRGTPGAQRQVRIDGAFLEAYRLISITPAPQSASASRHGYTFTFQAEGHDAPILFELLPGHLGRQTGTFRVDETPALQVRQFIYP